ncbi:hypothetical protein C8Q79DRAFT_351519 [Trametes meyenii]|nr:hypothetical protein C8Q79DRAFT_351519 [Trametes meyenii]
MPAERRAVVPNVPVSDYWHLSAAATVDRTIMRQHLCGLQPRLGGQRRQEDGGSSPRASHVLNEFGNAFAEWVQGPRYKTLRRSRRAHAVSLVHPLCLLRVFVWAILPDGYPLPRAIIPTLSTRPLVLQRAYLRLPRAPPPLPPCGALESTRISIRATSQPRPPGLLQRYSSVDRENGQTSSGRVPRRAPPHTHAAPAPTSDDPLYDGRSPY